MLRGSFPRSTISCRMDGSEVCGVCVFDRTVEEATAIMNDDPGVRAGVFTFEVHPCGGFPGDALP
jgi:hypothetical protein